MKTKGAHSRASIPIAAALTTCLSGCGNLDVLDPKGSIGLAEKSLIGTATFTMLLVVVPVILMTLWFAIRIFLLLIIRQARFASSSASASHSCNVTSTVMNDRFIPRTTRPANT